MANWAAVRKIEYDAQKCNTIIFTLVTLFLFDFSFFVCISFSFTLVKVYLKGKTYDLIFIICLPNRINPFMCFPKATSIPFIK